MVLFVGLGNPTSKYQLTRHNFGFMVIDSFINCHEAVKISKTSFKGDLYKVAHLLLLKPLTYMNLSGESVVAVVNFYKPSRIIVVHDDLDLPLGAVKFKIGGGTGGHNGLKSIDSYIGKEYERVRLGIGKPLKKEKVVLHVLEPFACNEIECVQKVIAHSCKALEELCSHSLETVRSKFTCKRELCFGS